MLIKILYILVIFLVIRLVANSINKYNQLQENVQKKKESEKKNKDIIDAEYTVLNDKKD